MLQFNQYMKLEKMPYIIYADLKSLIKKQMDVQKIQKNLQQHIQLNIFFRNIQCQLYIWVFHNLEYKHSLYRGEDFMKKFCSSLREHASNVINFETKKMLLLTKKEVKSH